MMPNINKELIIKLTEIKKGKQIYLFFSATSEYAINIISNKGNTKKINPKINLIKVKKFKCPSK
jgi:hypothetical protein